MDFLHGRHLEKDFFSSLHVPVCPSSSSGLPTFFLVLFIGRCKFCLSVDFVSTILCSILGGEEKVFNVLPLGDRVFRFLVSRKAVGFQVLDLRFFETDAFKVFFHLWHDGGPRWRHEFCLWRIEEDALWSVVRKPIPNHHRSYAGQLGPMQTHLGGQCSPRGRREAPDSGPEAGDEVGRLLHSSEQPAAMAPAFRWAEVLRKW